MPAVPPTPETASDPGRPPLVRLLLRRALRPVYRRRLYRWSWIAATDVDTESAPPLPEGFALTQATTADLPLLDQLGAGCPGGADLLAAGHRLWLVRDGDRVAFSAWTFSGTAPADASRTGWIELPPGLVIQEDVTTHPDFRGQGLAGAASARIAAQLVREGRAERFLGYVMDVNASSRRAAAKGGMREFAVVDVRKVGLLRDGDLWRLRSADRRGTFTWLRLTRPEPDAGTSPEDAALFQWLETAVRAGAPGPAAAVRTRRVPQAA